MGFSLYASTYVVSAFRRTVTVRLKPDTTYVYEYVYEAATC